MKMLNKKVNKKGIFYFIWKYENIVKNEKIYKFGVSERYDDPFKRFNQYKNGSEIIKYFMIQNLYENEQKIIELCKNKYKPSYNNGYEYFEGDLFTIINEIIEIIKDDIIKEYTLDRDILQEKFRKINIYYDQNINSQYLHYIVNKFNLHGEENNYNFREENIRYLLINYRRELEYKKSNGEYFESDQNEDLEDEECKYLEDEEWDECEECQEDSENMKIENNKETKSEEITLDICYHCVKYTTTSQSDVNRHLRRKNACASNSIFSYEDSKILSKNKYTFTFDIKNLTQDDYLYIITNYNNKYNVINHDFKKNELIINNEDLGESLCVSDNIEQSDNMESDIVPINIKSSLSKDLYKNIFYNKLTKLYLCGDCNMEYTHMNSVRYHLLHSCHKVVRNNLILQKNKEKLKNKN